jgi:hypothetical protein
MDSDKLRDFSLASRTEGQVVVDVVTIRTVAQRASLLRAPCRWSVTIHP